MRFPIWLCLAGLLAACSAPAVRQSGALPADGGDAAFQLEARFSVTAESERHSGRLSWRHASGGDDLRLASPFGQVLAEIEVRPGRASLLGADRSRRDAPDAQTLTQAVLGYPLPIERLAAWVRARPGPSAAVMRDAAGRPAVIDDDGWRIEYDYDGDAPGALPARLIVSRIGGPELRLRIEEWNLGQ